MPTTWLVTKSTPLGTRYLRGVGTKSFSTSWTKDWMKAREFDTKDYALHAVYAIKLRDAKGSYGVTESPTAQSS
jgi:hypothetical protein